MGRSYTTQIRVLLCAQCGAPLEAARAGGAITCGYCHAQNQVASRRDEPLAVQAPAQPAMAEPDRIQSLRIQDGTPLVPPASLHPLLMPGGAGFRPEKVEEAFHIYQATRREVLATHSPEAAERLFILTLIANTHLAKAGDHTRRRAILETTLDTLSLPRHVQVVRSLLASAAAKEGDLSSAEQWLGPCDPRSVDLGADSAFRVARAFVDTTRRDYARVVAMLGSIDDSYPIDDAWDPTAAVLRANALERLGDVNAAVAALRSRMSKEKHTGRRAMEQVVQLHPELQLCPLSFAQATQGHAQQAASQAGRGVDGGVGSIFFFVGLAVIALGVVLTVVIAGPIMVGTYQAGGGMTESLIAGVFAGGIIGVSTFPLGGIFALVGWKMRKSAQRSAWLRVNGIQAEGTVRAVEGTGVAINNVAQVRIDIEVRVPGRPPYRAATKALLTGEIASFASPGKVVPLRVHPDEPETIALELH